MRVLNKEFSAIHGVSLVAALAVVLSLSHHWLNFWGLPLLSLVLLLLVGVPVAALLIFQLLRRIWDRLAGISNKRWLFFLIPSVALASVFAWRTFTPPIVWHTIEMYPPSEYGRNEVRLIEIKVSQVRRVQFSRIKYLGGWRIQGDFLVPDGSDQRPLTYSFIGPVDKPVQLTFVTSPLGGSVALTLDGASLTIDLAGPHESLKAIELDVRYRFGIASWIVSSLVYLMDLLAILFLFTFLWLVQEVVQAEYPRSQPRAARDLSTHWKPIVILLAIGVAFHTANVLAVPLIVVGDSNTHLAGTMYWLKHFNLDGVNSGQGPGISFLFIPIMLIFGRNPWALKLFLHLLAIGCIPLGYQLGWQMTRKRWFAFLAGMVALLTADLYLYSNLVMTELPYIFFGLLFIVLLIDAFESFGWIWLIAAMIVGSFNVLLRPENIVMLGIGILLLIVRGIWELRGMKEKGRGLKSRSVWLRIGSAILVAVVPVFWWSAHNYRVHGFFGLSDHAGEAWYDGWVYFGESSHIAITDSHSESVGVINDALAAHPPSPDGTTDAPTSHEASSALMRAGYTRQQSVSILQQAAYDSILNDPLLSLELLFIKFREGLTPDMVAVFSGPLRDQDPGLSELKLTYFDEERITTGWLVDLQRVAYEIMTFWYRGFYRTWTWVSFGALGLSLYRRPVFLWIPLVLITGTRILLPTIVSLSHWRYVLAGILPLQIIGMSGLYSIGLFVAMLFGRTKAN